MIKEVTIANGNIINVDVYFSHTFKGRGGWHINLEATLEGEKFNSHVYTTDAQFIDALNDLKNEGTWDEVQAYYSDTFLSDFDEELCEWIEDTLEKSEEE